MGPEFLQCPSEWYEPFGLVIAESIVLGTPVLGANIGGIPELIKVGETGELFESGNGEDLRVKLLQLWNGKKCVVTNDFLAVDSYTNKLIFNIYS